MTRYHYARQGKQAGPVSVDQLQAMLRTRQLAPTDLVWTAGMPDWRPASAIPELLTTSTTRRERPLSRCPSGAQAPPTQNLASRSASHFAPDTDGALKIADRVKQLLTSLALTVSATGRHLGRVAACGMANAKIPA